MSKADIHSSTTKRGGTPALAASCLQEAFIPTFKGRFVVEVRTDAMEPRFHRKEWIAADSSMPIVADDDVLIALRDGKGRADSSCLIRRFLSWSGGQIVVKQFKPARETTIALSDVAAIIRIYAAGKREYMLPPKAYRVGKKRTALGRQP